MMIHPGPPFLERDVVPGGVILRCYSVPDQTLIFEQHLTDPCDVEAMAEQGADAAAKHGAANVCLVAYDGDSGERLPLADIFGANRIEP
jgi:hypothetical protein